MYRLLRRFALPAVLLVVLAFGTYKLTESPAIWGDEGLILELAVNLARHGKMMSQIAPGAYVSGAFMTTGFPVIYPVTASFKLFGIGLLQARAVMVVYMLLIAGIVFLFAQKRFGARQAVFASLLVATFPPLYANGKNVLGEIPGLFFLILFLWFVDRLESSEHKRPSDWLLAGLAAGLCLVTKPVFLTLLPAIIGGAILARKKIHWDARSWILASIGLLLPILVWLQTQFFPGDSVRDILSMYANPYQLDDIAAVIRTNVLRFVTESVPIYLLAVMGVWSFAIVPKLWKRQASLAESVAYAFCGLILIAYLRTPGWYRYFFPAQIISFIFLPASLEKLAEQLKRFVSWKYAAYIAAIPLSALILFQAYQTAFHSWVANTYASTMTRDLKEYFDAFDPTKSIYVVPEVIVFLPNANYYHYIYVVGFTFGDEEALGAVKKGIPDFLITYSHIWDAPENPYPLYEERTRIGRYVIAERSR